MKTTSHAALAILVLAAPAGALAQATANADDPLAPPPVATQEDDDDDFPWGLFGLLGLGGLLGRKRRDDDHVRGRTTDSTRR